MAINDQSAGGLPGGRGAGGERDRRRRGHGKAVPRESGGVHQPALSGQPRHQLHVPQHGEPVPDARHGDRTRVG